jgi:peptide-methionine (S)-S-oxide reductase
MSVWNRKTSMPEPDGALADRTDPITVSGVHYVNDSSYLPPYPDGAEVAYFAMGCFWGAERVFWRLDGVISTAVGYQGGYTVNATYADVCTGRAFWEEHDPTQGMRQGNDVGTQYRSAVYWTTEDQAAVAKESRDMYQERISARGFGEITTEMAPAGPFYFAEEYHQQYLAKNPNGYCGLAGTGVSCPVGLEA